jgi:hypothetical protein
MAIGSSIGFHSTRNKNDSQPSAQGNTLVGYYVHQLGHPWTAAIFITKSSPNEMTWLRSPEARSYGIPYDALTVEQSTRYADAVEGRIKPTAPAPAQRADAEPERKSICTPEEIAAGWHCFDGTADQRTHCFNAPATQKLAELPLLTVMTREMIEMRTDDERAVTAPDCRGMRDFLKKIAQHAQSTPLTAEEANVAMLLTNAFSECLRKH